MITAIINARTNSERLNKKHLYKIGNKTIFEHTIDKLLDIKEIKKIYLASGSRKNNYDYEKFIKSKYKNKIKFFYYNKENDVTGRIYNLSKKIDTKYSLMISGDCPLIDTNFIKRIYKNLSSNIHYDFIYSKKNLIHEGIELFKTSSWKLVSLHSKKKIFNENPGFIVKQNPAKFSILEYKPQKYEIKKLNIRFSIDTLSDLEFFNYVFLELKRKKLKFEIKNIFKIKNLKILNSHVLQRNPYDTKKVINLITTYNSIIGYGHYKRILSLKRELEERIFCKINLYILNKEKNNNKVISKINNIKQLTIIDLPLNYLNSFVKKIKYFNKIIIIDKILKNKKFTYLIPNLYFPKKKVSNKIFFGLNKLILNRSINYHNSYYSNIKTNIKKLLLIGATYSVDNEILEFMNKNKKDLKIVIGPLVKKKIISELKKNKFNLIVNPKNLFQIIKNSEKIYSRFGVSVFETIALNKKPIVFSKFNTSDKKIIFELKNKNFINIFGSPINNQLKTLNVDNCYNCITSLIEKKL